MPKLKNPDNYSGNISITYADTAYARMRPRIGGFGLIAQDKLSKKYSWEVQKWITCRDNFQADPTNIKKFLFVSGYNMGMNVIAFIDKFEATLGLRQITLMGLTQRKDTIWIQPTSWWTKYAMRRSLFTILLRAGRNYKRSKDNFEEALFSVIYTQRTKYALERFLNGNTRYTGKISGWYNQFYWNTIHLPKEEVHKRANRLLVKY